LISAKSVAERPRHRPGLFCALIVVTRARPEDRHPRLCPARAAPILMWEIPQMCRSLSAGLLGHGLIGQPGAESESLGDHARKTCRASRNCALASSRSRRDYGSARSLRLPGQQPVRPEPADIRGRGYDLVDAADLFAVFIDAPVVGIGIGREAGAPEGET
jgi:hypothetical protein